MVIKANSIIGIDKKAKPMNSVFFELLIPILTIPIMVNIKPINGQIKYNGIIQSVSKIAVL